MNPGYLLFLAILVMSLGILPVFLAEGDKEEQRDREEEKREEKEEVKETAKGVALIETHYLVFGILFLIVASAAGAFITMIYAGPSKSVEKIPAAPTRVRAHAQGGEAIFAPPALQEAPGNVRSAVTFGYNIMMDTRKYAPSFVGPKTGLSCRNCHFEGGRTQESISLVGVSAVYPKFMKQYNFPISLDVRVGECFKRNLSGKAPSPDSSVMQALLAYYHWISQGVPIGAEVPWLGLKPLGSKHIPNVRVGLRLFTDRCTMCHGPVGQGSAMAPPLWGEGSFTNGAEMNDVKKLSSFIFHNMPLGRPDLRMEQALDIEGFLVSQPRPAYKSQIK
jgi:thiosulfate dehydrogenase